MKSNKAYTYMLKYSLLVLAVFLISMGLIGYNFPDVITINNETRKLTESEMLTMVTIGLIFLLLFFVLYNRFVMVDLGGNKVTINDFHQEIESKWIDVKFISKVPFVKPPLYRIKLKGTNKTYLFTTQPNFFRIGNSSLDTSDMGHRIDKMKRELQI